MKSILDLCPRTQASALATAIALALTASAAQAALPYPTARTPVAQDLGLAPAGTLTVTVALKLRNTADLEPLVNTLYTPGSPGFHRFLTPAQFHERFAPSTQTVAEASAYFNRAGLTTRLESGSLLKVSGPAAAIQAAFNVTLHQYEVAANGRAAAYRFFAARGEPAIASPAVAANVAAIVGLDSQPHFAPRSRQAAGSVPAQRALAPNTTSGNAPGNWTVVDLASYYNVRPLYNQGINGSGRTVGIVTLASFTPSDAFTYWSSVGLSVDPNRLSVVDIDGGPGAPSDASGSDETTLDVEQSGGLAPAAKVVVYQAPNTDQAFVDAFAQAVNDNIADSVSVSWGEWEWFDTQATATSPRGRTVQLLKLFNNLFLQATLQGQSMYAASGDSGAYDLNREYSPPDYSLPLSVDSPAASGWITAAGGTTLPGTQNYGLPGGGTYSINIPSEQAWGWSYLTGLCAALGYDPVSCGIYSVGSGGGVSSYIPLPSYQSGLAGITSTLPGQSFIDYTTSPPTDYVDLPANYAGRNVPDVALNADPETGYVVAYTSDQTGYGVLSYYGGTSFVAPQLNGIAALLAQKTGGRIGLLNFPLYRLARSAAGYGGSAPPLRDITAGDNWYYSGVTGYDAATGVGTLDVSNLARALSR